MHGDNDSLTWDMNESPSEEDSNFLRDQINEFNFATTQIFDGREIMITIRDKNSEIMAGLYGWTWGGCLKVEYLWVQEGLRNTGLGTRLLRSAEQEAVSRGCELATLCTHDFQAPEFYKRHGYKVVGVIEGYPRGHSEMHLSKRLG